jgi:hypothetical protein
LFRKNSRQDSCSEEHPASVSRSDLKEAVYSSGILITITKHVFTFHVNDVDEIKDRGCTPNVLQARLLLGLRFELEEVRNMFLRNVGGLSRVDTALYPRKENS